MARILVIDDEELVRFTVRHALENAGYEVIEATDGAEAMTRLADGGVDLVITDVLMPNKEGIETIRDLRKQADPPRIIAISGGGRTDNVDFLELARKLGADDVLAKPFTARKLTETVAQVLGDTPAGSCPDGQRPLSRPGLARR